MTLPQPRLALARLSVWAQAEHPVRTASLMRKLTSSGSKHKKPSAVPTSTSPRERVAGLAAADEAARVPVPTVHDDRPNGIALANRAARIPGCE